MSGGRWQKMTYRIQEIEGIGPAYAKKLAQSGITNTGHLLAQCASAKGRKTMAQATGLDEAQLLKWANMADLMRVRRGIFRAVRGGRRRHRQGAQAARRADNLTARMEEVNAAKKLVRSGRA
jgi:hypothetical protein